MSNSTYFKYTAEHIGRARATKFVRELEADDIDVMYAGMSPVFDNEFIMVVATTTEEEAKKIKERVWALNNGAYCDMRKITADELEECYENA